MAVDKGHVDKKSVAEQVKIRFTTYVERREVIDFIKSKGIESLSGIGDVIRDSGLLAIKRGKKVVGYRPPEEY